MLWIYVDESGNLGEQGRYFVIAALVTTNGNRVKNIIKHFCAHNHLNEIKNRNLSFMDRQHILHLLNKQTDHYFSYICLDKHKIRERRFYKDKNVLFNYIFSHLLKPIVIRNHNDNICINLDNRALRVTSVRSLPDYVRLKMYAEWNFERDISIQYVNSKDAKLIQVVDIGAGIILEKYKSGKEHFYKQLNVKDKIHFPWNDFGLSSQISS